MRLTLAVAVACLTLGGLAAAGDATAAIRKQTDIPAEGLAPALSALAKDRNFQIVYVTEEIANVRTDGAVGEFTTEEALKQLLTGTGLTYRYLDDKTVTVGSAKMSLERSGSAAKITSIGPRDDANANQEGKKSSSQDFRVAQVDQGKGSSAPSVGQQSSTSQGSTNGASAGLEEIVVTAQKRAERLQDVPISISVLSGADLDNSTFRGVTEALNTVPGVSAYANNFEGQGTFLSFRGVGPGDLGVGASTVAYYVDSVPFGRIGSAAVPDANIYDLQQIEVLRGPQGTLYGANALNGVVRVLTADPDLNNFDFKSRGAVSTTEGGGANYGGDMAVNVPIIDGTLAARATVGDDHESGWISGPLGNNLNYSDTNNARLKIAAQLGDGLYLELSGWHSQSSANDPSFSGPDDRIVAVQPQPTYTQFNAYGFKVIYDLGFASLSSMASSVYWGSRQFLDLSYAPGLQGDSLPNEYTSRVFAEELNLVSKPAGPWRWSVGTMYRDDKDTSLASLILGPTTIGLANGDATSKSAAVFGELGEQFFDNKLQWSLGLRYFHDDEGTQQFAYAGIPALPKNSTTSSATTPRAVLTWRPSQNLTSYVSYSQGFRSGVPQSPSVITIDPQFPNAKPDKLTNYEAGLKGSLWERLLSYEVAVYYIKWQNIQQELNVPYAIPGSAGYLSAIINGNSASGHGADLSLKSNPVDGLTLAAEFSWNTLHFDSNVYSGGAVIFPEGSRPDNSAKYTAGGSIQYAVPLGGRGVKGVMSASGNYISPLNTTYLQAGTLEANSLLLVRGEMGIETPEHWTVKLFVDNATNWNGTQITIPPYGYLDPRQRPRTYGIRFDYHLR